MDNYTIERLRMICQGEPSSQLVDFCDNVCGKLQLGGGGGHLSLEALSIMAALDDTEAPCDHDYQTLEDGTRLCFKCDNRISPPPEDQPILLTKEDAGKRVIVRTFPEATGMKGVFMGKGPGGRYFIKYDDYPDEDEPVLESPDRVEVIDG
jgi:hypothetical protein